LGLANARIKGVVTATYDYIIFCDDDNWLYNDYVSRSYEIMESNNKIGVLGGRGIAVSDEELPFWFNSFQVAYAVGPQTLHSGYIKADSAVWGAGMVIRKYVYKKIIDAGFELLNSDRKGNLLSSGGDTEINRLYQLAGFKIYYDERLVFKHFIEKKRLTRNYYARLLAGFNEGGKKIALYNSIIRNRNYSTINKVIRYIYLLLKFFVLKIFIKTETQNLYNELSILTPFNLFFKNEDVAKIKKIKIYLEKNLK